MKDLEKEQQEMPVTEHNILIVDDTPTNLGVIVSFLQSAGFGIRIARSGESALKRVQYNHPDIILLDVLMPGMDGFETCRRLKANEATKNIPVIFMTSLTSVEDKVKGFEVGAVDYVTKPLAQEEVLVRVTTHLRLLDLTKNLKAQNRQLKVTSEAETTRLFAAVSQQREQLRTLTTRLTDVQEMERKQLARELHDEMGQALTAISINLDAIEKELANNYSVRIQERLVESKQLTAVTLEQLREMSLNLRPPMLDDLGLIPTLQWYVKRYVERVGIEVAFTAVNLADRLSPEIETTLYRIVQEGLTNVARHAQAAHVTLSLQRKQHQVFVVIADDGKGFDIEAVINRPMPDHGAGLLGIRERTILLGGKFDIQTAVNRGTQLSILIPTRSS